MYIPHHFREDRVEVLHDLIRRSGFATLVTLGAEGLTANHIPMVLDPAPEPFGTLCGHLSRSNPQWRDLSPGVLALAIFNGPEHYITPSWYPSKDEHGKVVPTWNFIAVHAYGKLQTFEDPALLRAHLEKLTALNEARFQRPWRISDAPSGFVDSAIKGIVGLELPIQRLEGKWKLSQNRVDADRRGVVEGLRSLGDPASMVMADLIDKQNP